MTISSSSSASGPFQQADGSIEWLGGVADGEHFGPMAVANGVLCTTDFAGSLTMIDAATGIVLQKKVNGGLVSPTWGGIAVIESWLFVPATAGRQATSSGFIRRRPIS